MPKPTRPSPPPRAGGTGTSPADRRTGGAGLTERETGTAGAHSGVLAVRALQAEEVALVPVLALLLVDEIQPAGIEGLEPLVPAHLPQVLRVPAEVEAEDSQVVAVLGALDGCGYAVAVLGPLPDHFVAGRGQAAACALGVLVQRGDLLGVLERAGRLLAGAQATVVGTAVTGAACLIAAVVLGAASRAAPVAVGVRDGTDEFFLLHRGRCLDSLGPCLLAEV